MSSTERMKPSWDDAPEWANYLAKDKGGYWHWYEDKPRFSSDNQVWLTYGLYELAMDGPVRPHESLEERPCVEVCV